MCNGPNTSWETAVSKFYASLRPAEAKIAEKLKPRLHNTSTKQVKCFLMTCTKQLQLFYTILL